MSPSAFQIHVPSTTANLGPGFDILGIALSLGIDLTFEFEEGSNYALMDDQGSPLPIPADKNLISKAYLTVLERAGVRPLEWKAVIRTDLLPGRGFGSSASALVAGVLAANQRLNQLGKNAWTLEQQVALLCEMEGHPDNVIPARVGGWVCALPSGNYTVRKLPEGFRILVLVPAHQQSTRESRGQLPDHYRLKDCVNNMLGLAAWFDYLERGNKDGLKKALQSDALHEPFRTPAIPQFQELRKLSLESGCLGTCLSGSGPGIAIFFEEDDVSKEALERISKKAGALSYQSQICEVDYRGAVAHRATEQKR
ncbi:MAG: homoserine kinase [Leptospiraceae bacterium]|nr:homoserine kinase [Leptospiraceae bacterium]